MGLMIGVIVHETSAPISPRTAMYIGFVGQLFLSALKCVIVPLIVSSIVVAIGTLDLSLSGKIGARAIVYYLSTTIVSRIMALSLTLFDSH